MTLYGALVARSARSTFHADLVVVAMGSLLLVVAAKITVPFYPVPISMQSFVVIGLGLALGPVRGTAAVLVYLAQGMAGFPVFAGTPEKGVGLAYMMGPTGGYLLGFLPVALLAGWLARRGWDRAPVTAMTAALIAGAAVYPTGLLWLGLVIGFDKPLLELGLYPFVLGDVFKAILAALLFPMVWKAIEKRAGI